MANLHRLPTWDPKGGLRCVVESPRGSKAKFKYEADLEIFTLTRSLILGVTYPYDWGFVPSTLAPDGDPLDVMMFHDTPTFSGVVMSCDPIGALLVTQRKSDGSGRQPNHRLFAVPKGSEREEESQDARELPRRVRQELEAFFIAAGALADKELEIVDWVGPTEARELVEEGERLFKSSR
ncbi:MAG: Inorganic pyrophosphatase [Myxococcales bacterium]|nr:Inorganic pyrophosphatase [Myxococcales bacterium]